MSEDAPWSRRRTGIFFGNRARARLASAAPVFARLWLKHEWDAPIIDHHGEWGRTGCAECLQTDYDGHAPDCALLAAFKQAGLR